MTPEEWRQGMENEARSVEDNVWSHDTHMAANRLEWRRAALAAAVFAGLGVGVVLLTQFLWRHETPGQLWLGVMIVSGALGVLLGLGRVTALAAGAGALAFMPGAWLAVVALQALMGEAAPSTPIFGVSEMDGAVLAVIVAFTAGVTHRAGIRYGPGIA